MRVYEFAKKYGVTSSDILSFLEKKGVNLPGHMSAIPKDAEPFLYAKFVSSGGETRECQPSSERGSKIQASVKKNDRGEQGKASLEKNQPSAQKKTVLVSRGRLVSEVASEMGRSVGDIILFLLEKGIACGRNHVLPEAALEDLAAHFGFVPVYPEAKDDFNEKIAGHLSKNVGREKVRWPLVVVIGHIDHGKTTLLDKIRQRDVAGGEAGGITQALGAYEVESSHGRIVFLDTPGHSAFSAMRARGVSVTDLAILVVAADDGVMPQTVEALRFAQKAKVPVIVAVNKIDLVGDEAVAIERIKRQLAQYDVLAEDWGGDVVFLPVSASKGAGVDELLELVVLQAQMMDLVADPAAPARAVVLESKIDSGYGPVATVIPLEGTLRKGDVFSCDGDVGKVRLLINSSGVSIAEAPPSTPAQVVGFNSLPGSGAFLTGISKSEAKSARRNRTQALLSGANSNRSKGFAEMGLGDVDEKEINIVCRADTVGSCDAIESLLKVFAEQKDLGVSVNLIGCSPGGVSLGDIMFAEESGAIIIAFQSRLERKAELLAKEKGVKVFHCRVIYDIEKMIKDLVDGASSAKLVEKVTGKAEVRKIFPLKSGVVIAGCYVQEGTIVSDGRVVCLRKGKNIAEAPISSLQRDKKSMKEVRSGFECAFICEGFNDWQEGDVAECVAKRPE